MYKKRLMIVLILMLTMSMVFAGCDGTTEPTQELEEEQVGETGSAVDDIEELVALFPDEGDYVPGNSITFEWEGIEGAENYRIRIIRQSDGAVFYNRMTESISSSYTVSNFSDDGTEYCWQVSMLNADGWSDWTDEVCFINSED